MAITTTAARDFDVQILTETVHGTLAKKNAFMDSLLVGGGAAVINDQMPYGPEMIGNEVTVPYFGTLGEFVSNPDGSSVTPVVLKQTSGTATVTRESLAMEVSRWAQGSSPMDRDPYEEGAEQIRVAVRRAMDSQLIAAAMTTPLVHDVYSASSPVNVSPDMIFDARAKWGDENSDIVGMIAHSRTVNDMRKLKGADGHPLLLESFKDGDVPRFAGVPVVESDKAPLTDSTMGTVTSAGSSPPVATITGTPTGPWNLVIDCVLGGAHTTATVRFSTDGGNTWSATLTTLGVGVALPLIDTNADSLVGNNGSTGLSVAFAAGTFNVDNEWSSTANLKVRTILLKRRAVAYWYNRNAMRFQTDENILADTDIAAMHLYAAAHLYRRTPGGTKPGAIAVAHNVSSYAG